MAFVEKKSESVLKLLLSVAVASASFSELKCFVGTFGVVQMFLGCFAVRITKLSFSMTLRNLFIPIHALKPSVAASRS